MDIILLIASDIHLRQLYHELFSSIHIEVVPIDSIENALVLLVINSFKAAVICADEKNMILVETFLRLRKKHKKLQSTKIAIISTIENVYTADLFKQDIFINPNILSCFEIGNAIKKLIYSE